VDPSRARLQNTRNVPAAFDVLYWNADGTEMTAQYNRDFRKFVERTH